MKDAFRQGKKDARAGKPRFVPTYWLDRDRYNEGYDKELAAMRSEDEQEAEARILASAGLAGATFKHVKTGGCYEVIAEALVEDTMEEAVVYKNVGSGAIWVRPREEFLDGRFRRLP